MTDQTINVNSTAIIAPLYAALVVNAWYSAQSLHLAEHGSLTKNDKTRLLKDTLTKMLTIQQSYRQEMDRDTDRQQD